MKKMISLLVVVLLGAVNAPAQTPATTAVPPDIVVLQKNWRVDVRNPTLDDDPFSANVQFNDALRAQRMSDLQNSIRVKGSESREPPPPPRPGKTNAPSPKHLTKYVYRAKIKNTGTKTIRAVDWGYTFVDPDTREELGRHRYSSQVKIRPGQNSDLIGHSASPQTFTVNVKNAGKELSEQIIIYRVEYDDGSVWENSAK